MTFNDHRCSSKGSLGGCVAARQKMDDGIEFSDED